ncbi:VOC family protein [Actinocorallia sp. API 0066]|uniref:VOC family protein n=1 Tax=Actinocorallia sp. API 0066 TaxID=2896846 RepID=UPI001E6409D1|nr:VOC family protein [Actinocorallia sp. API 0066]MCD0453684.1 VOC family protein [Actinocorallia sp. API 0066]
MTLSLGAVTVDCTEPKNLAHWWAKALNGEITMDYGSYVTVAGSGLVLSFQEVGEPTPGKNRAHVDFRSDDRLGDVARLKGLGAVEVAEHEVPGLAWTVLADPEGNRFCVAEERPVG